MAWVDGWVGKGGWVEATRTVDGRLAFVAMLEPTLCWRRKRGGGRGGGVGRGHYQSVWSELRLVVVVVL